MGFEFSSKKKDIEICGNTYQLNVDAQTAKLVADAGEKIRDLEKIAEDQPMDAITKAGEYLEGIIETMIGKSASEEIFANRAPSVVDRVELFAYLCQEFKQAQLENIISSSDILAKFGVR